VTDSIYFEGLVLLSFLAGLIPAMTLAVLYGLKVNWNNSMAGRAIFYLIMVTAASYLLSTVVLAWPHWFTEELGVIFRLVIRFAIAAVLWNLLRLYLRAQKEGREIDHSEPR
jgi:hypothetical protein